MFPLSDSVLYYLDIVGRRISHAAASFVPPPPRVMCIYSQNRISAEILRDSKILKYTYPLIEYSEATITCPSPYAPRRSPGNEPYSYNISDLLFYLASLLVDVFGQIISFLYSV